MLRTVVPAAKMREALGGGGPRDIAAATALVEPLLSLGRHRAHAVQEARRHEEANSGHGTKSMMVEGDTWWKRLRKPEARVRVAQNLAMGWSMLWKDLAIGFLVGGFLAAFVPDGWWKATFLGDASPWIKVSFDALIGPVVACLTFVCSIGNVPLAAVLRAGGPSFGAVLACFCAGLLVLPLLDVHRRGFGWRMAAFMAGLFFATMALSALIMDLAFSALGLVPSRDVDVRAQLRTSSLDLVFGALALYLFWTSRQHPMDHGHHHGEEHPEHGHGESRQGAAPAGA